MLYYKNLSTGSIYRTQEIIYNDKTKGLQLNRWNWDFKNWSGNIADHEETRKRLKNGVDIVPITEKEMLEKTNY